MRKRILFILIVFIGCTQNNKETIQINLNNSKNELNYSEFVESVNYIQLETRSDCLISNINQIVKDDSLLFLLDRKQKSLFIFNSNGKYLNKIQKVGKGIDEFITICSFCINPHLKTIYILDDIQQKLLEFDYHCIFKRLIPISKEDIVREINVLPNNNFVFCTPDYMPRGRDGIWEVDTAGRFVQSYFEISSKHKFVFIPYPYLSGLNQKLSFYDIFNNKFYSLSNGEIFLKYKFDLIQMLPDEFLLNERGVKEGGTGDFFLNRRFSETENHICFQYISSNKGTNYLLFNKKNRDIKMGKILTNNIDKLGSPRELFNYDRNSICGIVWKKHEYLNPLIQILTFGKQ